MIDYDTFKFKAFFNILRDESLLKTYGISKDDWETIKTEWQERHPTKEQNQLIEANRKVIVEELKQKRDIIMFRFLLTYKDDPKEFYEAANLKYSEDPEERFKYLNLEIKKSKQKIKIFRAQKEQLAEQIGKNQKEFDPEEHITNLNEVLASFEIAGISTGSYEEFTLGRYDGLSEVFNKKVKKQNSGKGR